MWSSERLRRRRGGAIARAVLVGLLALVSECLAGVELPDSLGQWYKPSNQRQVWLHTMFALRREVQAVREYAEQGDGERLVRWAERLAQSYRKLPEMVPEWADEIDTALAERLPKLAGAGDLAGTLVTLDRLERECAGCHREHQAVAALRFRWPRFDRLRVDDAAGGSRSYPEHMEQLSLEVNRVKIASEDQRWEAAAASLAALRDQLDALGRTCQGCHEGPLARERILGADTQLTLASLQQALSGQESAAVARQLGELAVQTCARCHGVHRLLADLQRQLFPQDRRRRP